MGLTAPAGKLPPLDENYMVYLGSNGLPGTLAE